MSLAVPYDARFGSMLIGAVSPFGGAGTPWYNLFRAIGVGNGNAVQAINTLIAFPILVARAAIIESLCINVAAAVATSVLRYGLYASDPVSMYPTTLIFGSAEFLGSGATGQRTTSGLAIPVVPGTVYWGALLTGTAAPNLTTISSSQSAGQNVVGLAEGSLSLGVGTGITVALAYAALPSPFTAGAVRNTGADPFSLYARSA